MLKTKLAHGGHQALVHSDQMVLVMAGGRLDHINCGQRRSRGELENTSKKPRDLTRNRNSDSQRKGQLTLSQSMVKNGDDVAVDDYDDVSQN
jgi:hypothetical protein